jgi:hypothetical protein
MRLLSLLLLLSFVGVAGLFAYQNEAVLTVRFWDREFALTVAQLVGITYLLGMFTGWSVLGVFRRSLRRVTQPQREHLAVG